MFRKLDSVSKSRGAAMRESVRRFCGWRAAYIAENVPPMQYPSMWIWSARASFWVARTAASTYPLM